MGAFLTILFERDEANISSHISCNSDKLGINGLTGIVLYSYNGSEQFSLNGFKMKGAYILLKDPTTISGAHNQSNHEKVFTWLTGKSAGEMEAFEMAGFSIAYESPGVGRMGYNSTTCNIDFNRVREEAVAKYTLLKFVLSSGNDGERQLDEAHQEFLFMVVNELKDYLHIRRLNKNLGYMGGTRFEMRDVRRINDQTVALVIKSYLVATWNYLKGKVVDVGSDLVNWFIRKMAMFR